MARSAVSTPSQPLPAVRDVVTLFKPITWFPPMWAFMCGIVSSGAAVGNRWAFVIAGIALTGPLVCGTSQAVNDWFDRHVDAINQPDRPIPSGRIAGRWGLYLAIAASLLSLVVATLLGPWVFAATAVGLAFAWAYSAPPVRLKQSGILGPAAVGLSYEGLSWFTGAAVMAGAFPQVPIVIVLLLYSAGAHGIMTLNDFKAIEGDRLTGIRSLPAVLGPSRSAQLACAVMAVPQIAVVILLAIWGMTMASFIVAALLVAQFALMPRLIADPIGRAAWYSALGVSLYVLGMLASALGLGGYI